MKQPYIYIYIDPKTNLPIYVGKGSGKRAWDHLRPSCDTHIGRTLKKRVLEGYIVQPCILNMPTDKSALLSEEFYIAGIGRADLGKGTLLNKSDGGDGPAGAVRTLEMRKHTSDIRKGMSNNWSGRKHSEESKKKISASKKGIASTPEAVAKRAKGRKDKNIPAWNKGLAHTDEHKAKISAGGKGREAWNKGQQHSDETKMKISEAGKGRIPWNKGIKYSNK